MQWDFLNLPVVYSEGWCHYSPIAQTIMPTKVILVVEWMWHALDSVRAGSSSYCYFGDPVERGDGG